jgi:restriction system protein
MELAEKASEQARALLSRAADAERKRLEKESKEAHVARMEAEVETKNAALEEVAADIESLLSSTLHVDDYVDLTSLRRKAIHKPFDRPDLESPIAKPSEVPLPAEPRLVLPEPPTGLASSFGKKKHEEAVAAAKASHEADLKEWRADARAAVMRRKLAEQEWAAAEAARVASLKSARDLYERQCAEHEAEIAESNRRLEDLINGLAYGTTEAVQEYISIVLSNSVYPDHFPVVHESTFEASTAELSLRTVVPEPSSLPEIKSYKYSKGTDEITSTPMSQKEMRDRYASAVHQVALRVFHEVFESDRRGLIKTIALEVGTNTVDPATGQRTYIPFVFAAAEREKFLALNLGAVVPALTLEHLGAAVSKNPHGLVPVKRAGIRRS